MRVYFKLAMDSLHTQPTKPPSLIVSLAILDELGRVARSPYRLRNGANLFECVATYVDNTKEKFAAYWTCPAVLPRGGLDFYGALGTDKLQSVRVNAAPNHIKYTDLTCWVKFPDGPKTDADQYPHQTVEFDYTEISNG